MGAREQIAYTNEHHGAMAADNFDVSIEMGRKHWHWQKATIGRMQQP
jgi:hypothetical protein